MYGYHEKKLRVNHFFTILWRFLILTITNVSILALEFAYKEAPKSAQSFVMGMFFFSQSLGSLLGGGLYELCSLGNDSWTPSFTQNSKKALQGHLNYYFFLLAGLQLVTLNVFLTVTVKYKLIQFNQKRTIPVIRTAKAERQSYLSTWHRCSQLFAHKQGNI